MRILKKLLSFCLILSVICTSLVFTGAGTVYAASTNFSITNHASGNPSVGDIFYVDFDFDFTTPPPKTNYLRFDGTENYALRFQPSDNTMYIQDHAWGKHMVKTLDSTKPNHMLMVHSIKGTGSAVETKVYINGILSATYTSADSGFVRPTANDTVSKVMADTTYWKNLTAEKSTSDLVSQYIVSCASASPDVVVNGGDTTKVYDFTILCPDGLSVYDLVNTKLTCTGTPTLKRGTSVITNLASAGQVQDDDILVLTSAKGTLINEYKITISRPVRVLPLEASYEYGTFTEIEAKIGDEVTETVTEDNLTLYINDREAVEATCTVVDKDVTFTDFDYDLGENNIKVVLSGVSGGPYESTDTTDTVISHPVTVLLSANEDFDEFNAITAEVSPYVTVEGTELYINGTLQNITPERDGNVLTFTGFEKVLGTMEAEVRVYNSRAPGGYYSDTKTTAVDKYNETPVQTKDPVSSNTAGEKVQVTAKVGTYGVSEGTTYVFESSYTLEGNASVDLVAGYVKTVNDASQYGKTDLVKIDKKSDGIYSLAVGGTTVSGKELTAGTEYDVTVELTPYTQKFNVVISDSNGIVYEETGKSFTPQSGFAIENLSYFLATLNSGKTAPIGTVSVGTSTVTHRGTEKLISAVTADDGYVSVTFNGSVANILEQPLTYSLLKDGVEIVPYDRELDASGTVLTLYSNEISRGETYEISLTPEFNIDNKAIGTALNQDVAVANAAYDITDVAFSAGSAPNTVTVEATLQNLESSAKDVTMLVRVIDVENGNEVCTAVYLKTFTAIPAGSTSYSADYVDIPCSGTQKAEIFFVDDLTNFGAVSNRIFEN